MGEQCVGPLTVHTVCNGGEESEVCVFLTLIIFAPLPLKDIAVHFYLCNKSALIWAKRRAPVRFCVCVDARGDTFTVNHPNITVKSGGVQVRVAT